MIAERERVGIRALDEAEAIEQVQGHRPRAVVVKVEPGEGRGEWVVTVEVDRGGAAW